MATTIGFLVLFFFLIAVFEYLNVEYATLKFRIRLHNMRKELKKLQDEKKISLDNKSARAIDKMMELSIRDAKYISLLSIMIMHLKLMNQHGMPAQANSNDDPCLKNIKREMMSAFIAYIKNQNIITYVVLVRPFVFCWKLIGITKQSIVDWIEDYMNNAWPSGKHIYMGRTTTQPA